MGDNRSKVLIVDDETMVRDFIKKSIRWSDGLVKLAGEASNGMEALVLYQEHLPDIILVDIKMPVMDGIEFVKEVRTMNEHVRIVLLTAYSDFWYAQEAINLKVEKYILKYEMNPELLNQVIKELTGQIEQQHKRETKQEILRRLLFEKHSLQEAKQMLHRVGIGWNDDSVYLCYIKNIDHENFRKIYRELTEKEYIKAEYRWVSEEAVVLYMSNRLCRDMLADLACIHETSLFIDAGTSVSLGKIQENFIKIIRVSKKSLFLEPGKLISTSLLGRVRPFLFDEGLQMIFQKLRERRYDEAKNCIRDLLEGKAAGSYDEEGLEVCLDQLIGGFFEVTSKQKSDIPHSYVLEVFKKIRTCTNIPQMVSIMWDEIDKVKRTANLSKKMCLILDYIDENYQRDIALETLAENFNVNPSYLSQMFRKEIRMTFKQYINGLKIKKAQELLLEDQLSIEQIAERIGYSNVNYFYKIFKKSTGKKPREYV